MRLIIVRHGDPDYTKDSLTQKGWREVELLAERLTRLEVKAFYVSPLGRARDTAEATLGRMGRTAVVCDWLREFPAQILRPDVTEGRAIAWDWLPQDWMKEACFYQQDKWQEHPVMQEGNAGKIYQEVAQGLDGLLAEHGYVREGTGTLYRAERSNRVNRIDSVISSSKKFFGVMSKYSQIARNSVIEGSTLPDTMLWI